MLIRHSVTGTSLRRLAQRNHALKPPKSWIARGYSSHTSKRPFSSSVSGSSSPTQKSKWLVSTLALAAAATSGYWLASASSIPEDLSSTLPLSKVRPVKVNGLMKDIKAAWNDLAAIVGEENITSLDGDLEFHSTSDWSTHEWDPMHKPNCIIYPASTDEVSRIMKICHARKIPVTGFSGGTSLEGHFTPTSGGISIDFGRMNKVLSLNKDDLDVVVQPAVGWQALNTQLSQDLLFFPPDPGPGAMIGGMVGTGCSGTNAYRYGTMRDWVINVTVVLADGTVIKTRQRPRKSSAGYNLTQMFIGSEGTLGLVTEATLKLTPLPQSTSVAVCSFGSVRQAADCVAGIVSQAIPLGAIEILDDAQMKYINDFRESSAKQWDEAPTLFLKFGGTPEAVKEQLKIVKALAKKNGSISFNLAANKEEEAELWSGRRDALWSVLSLREENHSVLTSDVAVPISRLPEQIERAQKQIKKLGIIGSIVGHAGDGNFHTILIYPKERHSEVEGFLHDMVDRALAAEGTCTGEHGVGIGKRNSVVDELGEDTVAAMRRLKQAYDPMCLLNCDKIFVTQDRSGGH